nr:GTP-binding protein [Candidatus Sigynarchaeota archaeon]
MKTYIVLGVIFSKFDHATGPQAAYWIPNELDQMTLDVVASKSLYVLVGEEQVIPKDLEILSFPSIEKKGVIKFVQIKDEKARGGFVNGTITLLFDEKDDTIFYKYKTKFEKPFSDFTDKVQQIEANHEQARNFISAFNEFHSRVTAILHDLFDEEIGTKSAVAFPQPEKQVTEMKKRSFKLVVVGDPEVGKTSTILRFTENVFRKTYITTMGVNVTGKTVDIGENFLVSFAIWDIAGQSKFSLTRPHFYEGARAELLVFDLTRPETLENAEKWHQDLKNHIKRDIPCILLANKA